MKIKWNQKLQFSTDLIQEQSNPTFNYMWAATRLQRFACRKHIMQLW